MVKWVEKVEKKPNLQIKVLIKQKSKRVLKLTLLLGHNFKDVYLGGKKLMSI